MSAPSPSSVATVFSKPRLIVLLVLAAIFADIVIAGPEVFCTESFGTLVLSPAIYVTLLPPTIGHFLNHALFTVPALNLVICGIPVLMLFAALVLGALAFRRNSLGLALAASGLILTVFTVYHLVLPMGFRVIA